MRETRLSGSVEGVMGNHDSYSDTAFRTQAHRHILARQVLRHLIPQNDRQEIHF
jgi:hypothetical protein